MDGSPVTVCKASPIVRVLAVFTPISSGRRYGTATAKMEGEHMNSGSGCNPLSIGYSLGHYNRVGQKGLQAS